MKSSRSAAFVACIVAVCLAAQERGHADSTTTPTVPIGWLTSSTNLVRAGKTTGLKWNITYPSTVTDYISVTGTSTVVPKETIDMEVRVLGAGVTSSNSNGTNLTFVPTEACISVAGGDYKRIFYGSNPSVQPDKVVFSASLKPSQAIKFGGRYYYNNSWSTFYSSSSGTNNVRTLVNGQTPPTTYPLYTAPSLESFLKPFLDGAGKVKIGPMDVIVFMELTHTDAQVNNQGYDLQDMVLLVTFKAKN